MAKNNLVMAGNKTNLWVVVGVALVVGLVAGIVGAGITGNVITGNAVTNVGAYRVDIPGSAHTSHFNYGANQDTYIRPGTNAGKVIMDYGNVGIGTANPQAKLDVNGNVKINGNLTANNIYTKAEIDGMLNPSSNSFTVEDGSNTHAQIKTTVKDGYIVIPIVYTNGVYTNGAFFVGNGKDSAHLTPIYNSNTNLIFNKTKNDDMMVLSWNSSTDAESYVIKFSFSQSNGVNYTDVWKMSAGDWGVSPVCDDKKPGDTCDVGRSTITINKVSSQGFEKSVVFSFSQGTSANKIFDASEKYYVQLPVVKNQGNPVYIYVKETETNKVVKTFRIFIDSTGKIAVHSYSGLLD